jgi:hypothetical protein
MSAKIDDGGPAFPTDPETYNGTGLCGMTLRDWLAGQALQSMDFTTVIEQAVEEGFKPTQAGEYIATACYKMADAMIEARKGGKR